VSAQHVLGQSLCRAGLLDEGIERLRHAALLRPDDFAIHFHLGAALGEADDLDAAEQSLRRAGELAPDVAAVHVNLGNIHRRRHQPAAAVASYERAIALEPELATAHNNVGTVYSDVGDQERAIEAYRRALAIDPDRAGTWSNLLLALQRSDRITAEQIVERHFAFGRHFAGRVQPLPPASFRPLERRRVVVGYVSSDLVSHAVSVFLEPLLRHHDRNRFEIRCYHTARSTDDVTERLQTSVEHFARVAADSDEELAARVRADGVDILVDLNGHTAGNRLLAFMRKPAPVQVTWLGYLGTTGTPAMDYRLTDAVADPPGRTEWQHTETLWRLPHSPWCYQDYAFARPVGPLPSLRNGWITFASLASPGKVSTAAVDLWSRVLSGVPGSRLLLTGNPLPERTALLDGTFARYGIDPARIVRHPILPTPDYLALYNEADIALDTLPYSGGTTTCDALWMGVPVITCAGERSVSRSAASILHGCGLAELVADDPAGYVERAVALARDSERLDALRASLRERFRSSPVHDAPGFARAVEDAYMAMAARVAFLA
jgi:predicted O-linked N-acetylglucosamine transferase (SPINDLY family)